MALGIAGATLGAGLGGALLSGIGGYIGQKKANEANARAAKEQMEFQERMSNTAYQRGMDDMRAAGLNPILAGKLGGASSPGGAMPIFHSQGGAAVSAAQAGLSSATGAMKMGQDTKLSFEKAISEEVNNFVKKGVINTAQGGDELANIVESNINKYIASAKDIKDAKEAARLWIDVGIQKAKASGRNAHKAFMKRVDGLMNIFSDKQKSTPWTVE